MILKLLETPVYHHLFTTNLPTIRDPMDLKSNHTVSVLTDPVPINKSRLGIHSSLLNYSSSMYITIPKRKPIPSKLDEVRASRWLDSMKSSSPPRRKLSKDSNIEFSSDENSIAYCSWLVSLPLLAKVLA